jgi:hypothetical protein
MTIPVISTWVKVLAAVVLAAVIVWGIHAYGQEQYGQGEKAERAVWLGRENTALTRANARIKQLEEKERAKERQNTADMAAASADYQKGLQDEKAKKDRVIDDLRRDNRRLRIAVKPDSCTDGSGGSGSGVSGAATGGRDGETRAELSVEASGFLVGLASEANEVVRQLTACQAVVIADREMCRASATEDRKQQREQ